MKYQSFIAALLIGTACVAPAADFRVGAVLDDLAATRRFQQVSISPDGSQVAWVEGSAGDRSEIYVDDLRQGGSPKRVTSCDRAPCAERHVAWSPNSERLAFLSDADHLGQMQLYVVPAHGGRARKLTSVTGYLSDPRWSPDGSHIAVLFAKDAQGGGGPLQAEPPAVGVIGAEIHNQRLTVVDIPSGLVHQVSPTDLNVYEYDWSPDGHSFAFTAALGPADDNWYIAQLYTMRWDAGTAKAIYKPQWQIAEPRWSPDGASIAFIEGLMSDEGSTGGDVFSIAAAGGEPVNRTPARSSSVSWLKWLSPAKLLMTEVAGGGSSITTLDLADGRGERLWQGDEQLRGGLAFSNFSLARDGRTAAAIRSDWQHPPEIWAGPIGDWKQITHANRDREPRMGKAQSITWTSDGLSVQGWLLYPHSFDAQRRYPMVVAPHGGPASAALPHWPNAGFSPAILSALDYFVFFPNPRGSYGQGEQFTRANIKDFGGGDLRDILAGVDAVLKTAPVDPHRIGITGWSYGGFMTMWAVTQTDRFRAAVAGAGLSNWQSYYGENAIDQWMIPYFGAPVYDDPAVYAKSSPINFIRTVHTPTLVVVGERDGECPAPQSFEYWHALKTLGVPTELVVYPGEGHLFRDRAHQRDVVERAAAWFEEYLK